jgi:hypothetical protein
VTGAEQHACIYTPKMVTKLPLTELGSCHVQRKAGRALALASVGSLLGAAW